MSDVLYEIDAMYRESPRELKDLAEQINAYADMILLQVLNERRVKTDQEYARRLKQLSAALQEHRPPPLQAKPPLGWPSNPRQG